MRSGPQRRATMRLVRTLKDAGRLEDVDHAEVEAAKGLADSVDENPANASLWKEYRAQIQRLRELHGDQDDTLDSLIASLSAPVGDSPPV